jgi:hypothetical protein
LKKEGNIMQIWLVDMLNPSSVSKIKVTNSKLLDDARLKQRLNRNSHAMEWWWRWADDEYGWFLRHSLSRNRQKAYSVFRETLLGGLHEGQSNARCLLAK